MSPLCRRLLSGLLVPCYLFEITACSTTRSVGVEQLQPAASA